MNYIASVLVFADFPPEQAVTLLEKIIELYHHAPESAGFFENVAVFKYMVRTHLPEVDQGLRNLQLDLELAFDAFLCLWAQRCPLAVVVRLWDFLFLHGRRGSFALLLASLARVSEAFAGGGAGSGREAGQKALDAFHASFRDPSTGDLLAAAEAWLGRSDFLTERPEPLVACPLFRAACFGAVQGQEIAALREGEFFRERSIVASLRGQIGQLESDYVSLRANCAVAAAVVLGLVSVGGISVVAFLSAPVAKAGTAVTINSAMALCWFWPPDAPPGDLAQESDSAASRAPGALVARSDAGALPGFGPRLARALQGLLPCDALQELLDDACVWAGLGEPAALVLGEPMHL